MVHSKILKSKTPSKASYLCIKKILWKKVDLLLKGEEGKLHYVLIKDFNTFMYDHTFAVIAYKILVQKKY